MLQLPTRPTTNDTLIPYTTHSRTAANRAAEEAKIVGGGIGGRDIKRAAFVDVVDQRRGTVEFMCAIGAIEESGGGRPLFRVDQRVEDRKSTRLNSSH